MERQLSVGQHLRELRRRLILSCLAILVGAMAGFYFHETLIDLLKLPGGLNEPGAPEVQAISITENLGITVKVSMVAGLRAGLPRSCCTKSSGLWLPA